MIKIVYIIDCLDSDLGGTENQLKKMINGLDRKKFDVTLVCLTDHKWFRENASMFKCDSKVIEINRIGRAYTYMNFFRLVRFLHSFRPDVVQTFFPAGNILGVLAARMAGVKNIISSRRDYGEWMDRKYVLVTRFANIFVKKIIANSNPVKKLTEEEEKVDPSKVMVFHNGIDTRGFRDLPQDCSLKRELNIPDNNRVIGIVANFKPMKHHFTFIKAASEICKARDDVSFILIGKGPKRQETERLAEELNVGGKVRFLGEQADIIPYLSIMDVGVNCSRQEGLSNAIMEYMAAGVPCVVSDAGGNLDLITDGVDGYVFRLDDYRSLASLAQKLLDDEVTRERFIRNARDKMEKFMSTNAMLSNYEMLYRKLQNE